MVPAVARDLNQSTCIRLAYFQNRQHALPHTFIPGRTLAFEPKSALSRVGRVCAEDGERDLARQRQALRRVVLCHHAGVFAEAYVEPQ